MEKILSTKIANTVNELKETINFVVGELKDTIKVNLNALESVKRNLAYAHNEMEEIFSIADDLSITMEMIAEDANDTCDNLGVILAEIDPNNFGDEEEDFEEEEPCIVVEDTETGEETEYPIN